MTVVDDLTEQIAAARQGLAEARQVTERLRAERQCIRSAIYQEEMAKAWAVIEERSAAEAGHLAQPYADAKAAQEAAEGHVRDLLIARGGAKLPANGDSRVQEWKTPPRFAKDCTPYLTGRRGVLEVWTEESPRPTCYRSVWSPPKQGDVVVRLFKKDGTPSLKWDSYVPGRWKPLDWTPENPETADV